MRTRSKNRLHVAILLHDISVKESEITTLKGKIEESQKQKVRTEKSLSQTHRVLREVKETLSVDSGVGMDRLETDESIGEILSDPLETMEVFEEVYDAGDCGKRDPERSPPISPRNSKSSKQSGEVGQGGITTDQIHTKKINTRTQWERTQERVVRRSGKVM